MDANGDPWGLDRIDQGALPLSGTYTYTSTGAGVHAYIIDTGIWTLHPEFGGRANNVFDAYQDRKSTRLNSSHSQISYAVFCLKKKKQLIRSEHPWELPSQQNVVWADRARKKRVFRPAASEGLRTARHSR